LSDEVLFFKEKDPKELFPNALPRRWDVIETTVHDCMDAGGKVTPGAITEEVQLSVVTTGTLCLRDPSQQNTDECSN